MDRDSRGRHEGRGEQQQQDPESTHCGWVKGCDKGSFRSHNHLLATSSQALPSVKDPPRPPALHPLDSVGILSISGAPCPGLASLRSGSSPLPTFAPSPGLQLGHSAPDTAGYGQLISSFGLEPEQITGAFVGCHSSSRLATPQLSHHAHHPRSPRILSTPLSSLCHNHTS